jgi:hypothetical protein
MSRETIHAIRSAYHSLHRHRVVSAALDEIRETVPDLPEIRMLIEFITSSKRGIVPSLNAHESPVAGGIRPDRDHSGPQRVRYAGAYEQLS